MSRDVSWGIYIATHLPGRRRRFAVMVVLPYYLHDYKEFGKVVLLGEFLAVAAVMMCLMFVMADMGKPERVLNVLLHPSPRSVMFWDVISLSGYLVINIICGWVVLTAESKGVPSPRWLKPIVSSPSLGSQHPHRHGLSICGPAGPSSLADGSDGPEVPGLCLHCGTGLADLAGSIAASNGRL